MSSRARRAPPLPPEPSARRFLSTSPVCFSAQGILVFGYNNGRMIYAIKGILILKRPQFFVVETSGVSFKLAAPAGVLAALPEIGVSVSIFTYLHVREDALDLYGFLTEAERSLFESLNGVTGIGPRSALGVMGIAKIDQLSAAINEGRPELLTRASGIGRKTAERIVLELRGKLTAIAPQQALLLMESDAELEETLVNLGYSRSQAKMFLAKIDPKVTGFKERFKEALKQAKH